jgi:Ricin-type beta-trefoil lectin domain-like
MTPLESSSYRKSVLSMCVLLAGSLTCQAQNDVLTWHNDVARTGQNLSEAILTPATVYASNFGLLANVVVDGKVDAQPLYASAVTLGAQGTHNVLYIATEHDTVYAVNADSGAVFWKKRMLGPGETPSDDRNCEQVTPEIGITATPAIDRLAGAQGTIFLVAMSMDASGNYYQRIHALDLSTGAEQPNSPVVVRATRPGTGDGSSSGTVTFSPGQYKERAALLLLNGILYTSWGSHCDVRPYGGWLMAYNEANLIQKSVIDFAPNGTGAALWNAGAGPAADASGNIYVALANGTFDTTQTAGLPSKGDYGNAVAKLALQSGNLNVLDYWTMYNTASESGGNVDLGSGGLMVLPDQVDSTVVARHLAVAAGKDTNLYLLNRDNMGHYNASNNSTIYQQLSGALPGGVWSSPAYFNGKVYYGSSGSTLQALQLSQGKLLTTVVQATSNTFGFPGTTPSISAYGAANGIVWAAENTSPAVLHAYEARNLDVELYNSGQASHSRDQFGMGNKFIVPTIVNGKVYVATTNSVGIFGFVRRSIPMIADGPYVLINANSLLVLDDPGFSKNSGVAMYQWAANGQVNQKWFFSFNGQGYYTIQNVSSKLFLTSPGSRNSAGSSLEQATPLNTDAQLWSLTSTATGIVIRNKATGLVMDDIGFTKRAGANIIVWTVNGGINQSWKIN